MCQRESHRKDHENPSTPEMILDHVVGETHVTDIQKSDKLDTKHVRYRHHANSNIERPTAASHLSLLPDHMQELIGTKDHAHSSIGIKAIPMLL